jgi:hypothetical protein
MTVKCFVIQAIGFCKSFQVYFSTCNNKLECLSLPATSALAQYLQTRMEPTLRERSLMVRCKCLKVANTLAYYNKELITIVKSLAIKAKAFCKSFQVYFSTCYNKLECLSLPATSALSLYLQTRLEPTLRVRS